MFELGSLLTTIQEGSADVLPKGPLDLHCEAEPSFSDQCAALGSKATVQCHGGGGGVASLSLRPRFFLSSFVACACARMRGCARA